MNCVVLKGSIMDASEIEAIAQRVAQIVSERGPKRTDATSPGELNDERRVLNMLSQQAAADDTPVDVNPNAVVNREQMATYYIYGRSSSANFDRREKLADGHAFPKLT